MDRRLLLKMLGALPLGGLGVGAHAGAGQRVVVAGAGIIGASIAYHLAKSGASVTLIDGEGPATHASRGTFAWVNATWAKQPRHYHALNQDGVTNWLTLAADLKIPIRQTGSLEWFESSARQQKLVDQINEQIAWGEPARMVDRSTLQKLEPNLDFGEAQQAAFSGNDAAVDPVAATRLIVASAAAMGAVVKYPCRLTGTSYQGDELKEVTTSTGVIRADKLVLATGAAPDVAAQFADTEVPQRSTPGVIVITKPMRRVINRIISAPGVHLHQRGDGCIVIGEQEGPPQNEAHAMRLAARPNQFPARALAEEHAARMLAVALQFVPAMADAEVGDVYIGWRPLPVDGHPVIGASPNRPDVYLAIMHSGVSLAPIVGQLAAHELLSGTAIERLDAFRPGRDFKLVKRY